MPLTASAIFQNWVPADLLIAITLLLAFLWGLYKGVVRQVFGLAALLVGCWGAWHLSGKVQTWLASLTGWGPQGGRLLAYLLTFVGLLVLVLLIGRLADRLIRLVQLGWLNRLLGGIFALAKWLFIWVILLFLLQNLGKVLSVPMDNLWEGSRFHPFFDRLLQVVFPYLNTLGQ